MGGSRRLGWLDSACSGFGSGRAVDDLGFGFEIGGSGRLGLVLYFFEKKNSRVIYSVVV